MDAEGLVKISRDNIPAGRKSPGSPKRRWTNLNPAVSNLLMSGLKEEEENGTNMYQELRLRD